MMRDKALVSSHLEAEAEGFAGDDFRSSDSGGVRRICWALTHFVVTGSDLGVTDYWTQFSGSNFGSTS
ncbi:hypothetical protein Hdeb2414_s0013g00413901 [Helianthus debilis subsp. tardiflorus]